MEVDPPSPVPEDKCGFNSSPYLINRVNYKQPETSAWIAKEADAYWESLNDSSMALIFQVDIDLFIVFFKYLRRYGYTNLKQNYTFVRCCKASIGAWKKEKLMVFGKTSA